MYLYLRNLLEKPDKPDVPEGFVILLERRKLLILFNILELEVNLFAQVESLLAELHDTVEVLHGLVILLTELNVDGLVQLDQACVQVHLLRLGNVEDDGGGIVVMLGNLQIMGTCLMIRSRWLLIFSQIFQNSVLR